MSMQNADKGAQQGVLASLSVAAASDIGYSRADNEDSFVTGEQIWAVADGMGGQAAGRIASQIAVRCIEECDSSGLVDQARIADLVTHANAEILAYGTRHPEAAGLGTTVAGIALVMLAGQTHWLVFNVGDSRVYRLSGGHLIQESTDHSEVQYLVDQGTISADQARTHPQRNVLTRCLGSVQPPKADMRLVPYLVGDQILICSDGLTSEIEDATIERILLASPNTGDAVRELINTALSHGGHDNVTAVVVEVVAAAGGWQDETLVEDTLPAAPEGIHESVVA